MIPLQVPVPLIRTVLLLWLNLNVASAAVKQGQPQPPQPLYETIRQIQEAQLHYRTFPQRHREEAVVIEWGNSAIISAIDASVAYFGPQTSHAALLEVETAPLLADPIDGVVRQKSDANRTDRDDFNDEEDIDEDAPIRLVTVFTNADAIHGNVAVVTDAAVTELLQKNINNTTTTPITCLDLAMIAQNSKAAALIIVHINEDRPDDAPRCTIPIGREEEASRIDIPVVTISLASIDVFTSATITEDTKPEDVINHGMPERYVVASFFFGFRFVDSLFTFYFPNDGSNDFNCIHSLIHSLLSRIRLYAGGERPFFEDIGSIEPMVYMIHNLLTLEECNTLITDAQQQTFQSISTTTTISSSSSSSSSSRNSNTHTPPANPLLEYMTDTTPYVNVDRTVLQYGFFQSIGMKAIEERIEQVTGFPVLQYSDWIIDRLSVNSTVHPHYDNTYVPSHLIPHATITVFLNDFDGVQLEGGQLIYPSIGTGGVDANGGSITAKNTDPIQIRPTQGLAVVHHNINEKQVLEYHSLHAMLPVTTKRRTENDHSNNDDMNDDSTSSTTTPSYLYIARKYILPVPISKIRRYTFPMYLLLFGQHSFIQQQLTTCFYICIQQFGVDQGNMYFDYILIGIPILLLTIVVALVGYIVYQQFQNSQLDTTTTVNLSSAPKMTSTPATTTGAGKTKAKNGGSSSTKKKN
jgi:hypothetical protein